MAPVINVRARFAILHGHVLQLERRARYPTDSECVKSLQALLCYM
jgi:hypothetical protein